MLVLVSDLHITDETAANNVNPEAFELLGAEIVDAATARGDDVDRYLERTRRKLYG